MVALVDRLLGTAAALGCQGRVLDQPAERVGHCPHVVRLEKEPAAGIFDQLSI